MFARENGTQSKRRLILMYRRRRMTDGSLKLSETVRCSRSKTEITSTFPWHHSVTAFCQLTILRGSYDAFRSSVCSNLNEFCPTLVEVSIPADTVKRADCRGRAPRGVVGRLCVDRLLTPSVPVARRRTRA